MTGAQLALVIAATAFFLLFLFITIIAICLIVKVMRDVF